MRGQTTISDVRRRRLFTEAAVRERWRDIARDAQNVVEQYEMHDEGFSPASVRGLVNAVGTGPGRRRPRERLDSLKRYLAWRKHRGDPWDVVVDEITDRLTRLETEVADLIERIEDEYALEPLEPAERDALIREMHLRLTEIYLDALANYCEIEEDIS